MASVRRPRDGRGWEARYRSPAGRSLSRSFHTKREAQRFLVEVERDKSRGAWVDPAGGRILLKDWIDQWWATTTNLRPTTRARDENYISNYIQPSFGETSLAQIRQLDVRSWVAELSGRGLAPATAVKAYQILSKIMRAAVDGGLIQITPCRSIPLPKIEREEMRFLTPVEIAQLAEAIDLRYRGLVYLAAYGGLRRGELAGLRVSRVNLLAAQVDVAEIMVEVRGKVTFGPPKTRAGRRTIRLPRHIADELAEHMLRRPSATSDLVFQGPAGGVMRSSQFRQRVWLPAIKDAALEPLRVHDLRHTAVSLWIAAGASVKEIAVRAGHASVASVLDRYGHLLPESDEELRARLDQLFEAGRADADASSGGRVVSLRAT